MRHDISTALEANEARYQAIVEHATEGIFQTTPGGRFLTANPALARILGYESAEALVAERTDIAAQGFRHPERREEFRLLLEAQSSIRGFEYEALRKDGSVTWVSETAWVVRGEAGEPLYYEGILEDIDARKRAQAALREVDRRKAAILQSALDAIVTIDGAGTVVEFNPAAERMFGYTCAEAVGREMAELIVPPDMRERHRRGLARQVATGVATVMGSRLEMQAQRRDGSLFPAELSIVRIGHGDDPPAFTGFIRDITERKQVEAKLLRDEAFLDIVGRAARMGAWMVDLETLCIHWSDEVCRFRGFPPGTTVTLEEAAALYAPEWREDAARVLRRCIEEGIAFDVEAEALTVTGQRVWIRSIGHAERDGAGAIRSVHGAMQDITARKRAEAEICRASDQVVTTLESISDAFLTVDRDWRFTYLNARCERILQRPRGELLGRNMWEVFPEAVGSTFDLQYRRALAERCTVEFEEYYAPLGVWLALSVYPSGDGLAIYFRDVSNRKAAEQARESLEAQLRESQKMEAIGRLAGRVAHDFNNILGAILGNQELARLACAGNIAALEGLEEIRKAGYRGRDLVGQIVSFSGRQPIARHRVDLGALAGESVNRLRAMLPPGVRIESHLQAAAPAILADAFQVGQVIANLCTNAAQAFGSQGGRIDVHVDAVAVGEDREDALRELTPGPHARLSVVDNGQGMDPETLQRIFEPFFTTRPMGTAPGTGLGLSVVSGIVRAHGAAIAVASMPGQGTRFDVYFPGVAGLAEVRPESVRAPSGGEHVLYLDDDEALVLLTQRLLERRGYRVSAFRSQPEALAALRAAPEGFDLLVTDYNMPGMSGLDVAREARAIRPDLPVALASGYISEELAEQAAAAGVRELIFKPNVVSEFVDVVERLLGSVRIP